MFWADTIGCEYIYSKLKSWYEAYGDFFKPSTFLEQKAAKGLPLVRIFLTILLHLYLYILFILFNSIIDVLHDAS